MLVRKSLSAILVSFGFIGSAHAADLAVSRFQVVDPSGDIYSGAAVTFEVDIDNNDATSVADAELEIDVPGTMVVELANVPGGCSASGFTAPQTLTCSLPTLTRDSGNPDHTLTFIATAETANALTGTVTVSSPTNTDANGSNDSLSLTPTVDSGADLTLNLSTSTSSTPAGGIYSYFGDVSNGGPDAVNAARVTFSLPPSADFGYQSSTGSSWSCVQSGTGSQTVTCDYSGASIAAGASFPQITITGSADVDSGTLSAQADVEVTQVGIGDPELSDNLDGPAVVTITPGTDLEARVQIASSFITGDAGTLTLTIDNNGPTDISGGSEIVHTLSPDLALDGPLPTGCVDNSGTITCTAGSMNSGDVEDFVIPVRALTDTGGNQTISATVTAPPGIDDPISSNDTGSDTFRIDDPAADIFLQSKTKTPNPVEAGENMTSTIRVENDGPSVLDWSPANPLVITDDLGADETYVSVSTSGWSCATAASPDAAYTTRVTCTTTDSGSVAVDARKTLQIVTQAGASADGDITNNACVDTSGLAVADPNTGNNCRSRTSRATTEEANLSIQAEVSTNGSTGFVDTASPASALTISDTTTSHFYRLTVSNDAGSDTARTVYIRSEDLAPWMNTTVNFNGGSVDHDTAVSVFSASSGVTCSGLGNNDNIRCEATNLAPGTSVTLVLQVDRPILDGARNTTFAVSSPDTVETDTSDNSDVARVDIEPVADLTVDDKRVSPNPPQSGEDATYLIDIKNIGPNTGDAVASADFIDPTLFEVTSVTTTAPGGLCDYDTTTADTATCSMGSVDRGETFQMSISVRPRFPFNGASNPGDFPVSHTNTATVSTTTAEIDPVGNNSRSLTHDVGSPSLDMRVTNAEPSGFVEPSTYGTTLLYEVVTRNGGLTQGTNVTTTVTPAPPAGYEMAYNAGSSTIPVGVNCAQASNSDPVICTYPNMSTSDSETVILAFDLVDVGGGAPASTITAGTTAVVTSDQQDYDTPIANNTASQTTTIIPSTDLEVVSKTRVSPASPAPINIAEPVVYDIVFRNNGPSATPQVRVTDTLPAGFERTATAVTFTPAGTTTVSGSTCSTSTTVLCVVDGNFPGNGDLITMRIEVAATFPFSGNTGDPIVNAASIAVGQTVGGDPISADENASNNSASTSDGLLQLSSLSGTVYSDNDRGDDFDTGEGIESVTMTLTGTDLYGNSVNVVVQTQADGSYTFTGLPPSDASGYTITQTQPSGHFDYQETAGSASGTVSNGTFGSNANQNAITQIVLGEGVDETGYLFADYAAATVSGSIYSDDDNDGTRDGGESGITSGYAATPHLQLTGTDYAGTSVSETVSVNGSGAYSFDDLPPSNGAGYVVEQLQEPSGFYDGLEENGSGATLAGTVDGSEQIDVGTVDPGVSLSDRNFGQVAVSTFAGIVYQDDNGNGSRQGGETDTFTGATLELSGTDDLGRTISCTVTSGADGAFAFPVAACPEIRPGSYAITMTDAPDRLITGTTAGSASGTQGTSDVTSITVTAGTAGTGYLFGVENNDIQANNNDFTSTPINGFEGGNTASVFPDDRINGAVFADGDVVPSITSDGGLTGVSINSDGTLTVPAGTPAGTYTVGYQICETVNTGNCDPATAIIEINPPIIRANPDDFTGTEINGADGGITASVFTDDRLNNAPFADSEIAATILGDGGLTGVTINSNGTLNVPAGTPEGTYTVSYQICEVLNATNCHDSTAMILVGAPSIIANDDDFTGTAINGADGGNTASVFPDDRLNDAVFADGDVIPSIVLDGGLTGVSINADGTLSVPAGTPEGTYHVTYQICEALNTDNCDPAIASILIEPPAIVANDDDFTGTPFNGADGGSTTSVFPNDRLNDVVFADAEVTPSILSDGGLTGAVLNADGTIDVPAGTPEGIYSVTYQICEVLNSDNCDPAIATIAVDAAPIVANNNDFSATPINGADGGTTTSVFPDDRLNGAVFDDADVIPSLLDDGGLTGIGINPDGTLSVPTGTPAGTYQVEYQICETLNTDNCDPAFVTIIIEAAPIIARDNDFTPTPVIGSEGGTLGNILPNDSLNDESVDAADVTITLVSSVPEVELNLTTGEVEVPAGTPAGTYTFEYRICENLNPGNCDTAITTVLVDAAAIDANDQDYSATPVNGAEGGTLPTVFSNDTLNGAAFDPSDVNATIEDDGGLTGVTINPDGTISVPAGSIAGTYTVEYQICEVLNPTNCDTAEIIITVVTDASLAGTVFLDANADDALQSGETLLPGYTVELRANGSVIATATTDANGAYAFEGLDPDLSYEIVFIESNTGTVIDAIDQIDLIPGEDRTGLDEPVAPSGTVYDVAENEAVVGGTVTVVDMNGQPLPPACFSDPSQQGQLTTADGYYFVSLVPGGAASCPMSGAEYRVDVTLPNGLTGVFGATPLDVSEGALDPGICTNDAFSGPVCEVSNSPDRPDASQLPPFYAQFSVGAGDPEFANNHIPVNSAMSQAPLVTTKRTLSANASVGSVIVYTITVSNPYDVPQSNVDIVDQLPAGLVFIAGSGRVNGAEVEPSVETRTLTWSGQSVPARSAVEITLGVAVGAGVTVGEYVNTAYADNGPQDVRISNIAEATVRITPDEIFDCSEVLGKVFEDTNRNGIQDDGEEGLPGVRVATVKGLLITTDEYGRYHIACAATPKPGIGSNFIVKLDERTLPTGFEVMTENPRVVRLTQGKMSQVDFGVGALRPVEFQIRPEAFVNETLEMTDRTKSDVEQLVEILGQEPSILTLVYFGETLSDDRLALIKQALEDRWSDQGEPYKLVIETEVVNSSQNP
ncbi:MAG: SdrD B-like domain-containing protein [Henriciella sp.]